MKKFLFTLFFIIVLAGAAFFFGWAQMGIPPDSVGVLQSKSHGTCATPILPGEFNWFWYKLIPANTKTAIFRLNPVRRDFSASGTLPLAATYTAFTALDSDFSWKLEAHFSFSLTPHTLVLLVSANTVSSQDDLLTYEAELADQAEAYLLGRMELLEALVETGETSQLDLEIAEQFPQIANFSLIIKSSKMPDYALYRQSKSIYEDYINRQKEYMAIQLQEKAKNRGDLNLKFDELEQYGVLLTRFPVLLDFLAIENSKK